MNCQYCNKLCKNKNSLAQHEIRCKRNPNKLEVNSNFKKYNDQVKNGEIIKENTNHYTKAKNLGLPKPKISEETRKKISEASKKQKWDDERKSQHSKVMTQVAKDNPESYSASNVSGRCKSSYIIDSYGNETTVHGSWERLVAEHLNECNIKWTNTIEEVFEYYWEGRMRRYYPDFYLPEYDTYIEVKGYQRDRDIEKWKSLDNLIVLKKSEIDDIKNKIFYIKKFFN